MDAMPVCAEKLLQAANPRHAKPISAGAKRNRGESNMGKDTNDMIGGL